MEQCLSLSLPGVQSAKSLNDSQLVAAIAVELLNWENVRIDPAGRVTGCPPHTLTLLPVIAPEWPRDIVAAQFLEEVIRTRRIWPQYIAALSEVSGDASLASARERSESALLAVRSVE